MGLGHAGHPAGGYARLVERLAGAAGGEKLNAHIIKAPGDANHLVLVLVLDGNDDAPALLGGLHTSALEGLEQRLGEGLGQAQALAGGLHLGAQAGVHVGELLEGEHRHLDGVVVRLPVDARAVPQVAQLLPQHHPGGQVDDGHAGDLGDIGDGTGGAGIDLDDIHLVVIDDELDVD